MNPSIRWILLALLLLPLAEASAIKGKGRPLGSPYASLVHAIAPNSRVAVTDLYDGLSGDITALSHLWRDRVEAQLRRLNIRLVARLDIALVDEDNEIHGAQGKDENALSRSGADVLITGRYYIQFAAEAGKPDQVELQLKAVNTKNYQVAGGRAVVPYPLEYRWQRMTSKVWYNAYHGAMEQWPMT